MPNPETGFTLPHMRDYLASLVKNGFFPSGFVNQVEQTEEDIRTNPYAFFQGLHLFSESVSGRGFPFNITDKSHGLRVRPKDERAYELYVARIVYPEGLGHNLLISWGDPHYSEIAANYEDEDNTRKLILPFTWFWSDFYNLRGGWFWKGSPDEDQSDTVDPELFWAAIDSGAAAIFKLAPPPLFDQLTQQMVRRDQ